MSKLNFTVDFPAFYMEMTEPGNIHNIGPGGAMSLRIVLLGLKRIAQIALAAESHETLSVLADLGIVDLNG